MRPDQDLVLVLLALELHLDAFLREFFLDPLKEGGNCHGPLRLDDPGLHAHPLRLQNLVSQLGLHVGVDDANHDEEEKGGQNNKQFVPFHQLTSINFSLIKS